MWKAFSSRYFLIISRCANHRSKLTHHIHFLSGHDDIISHAAYYAYCLIWIYGWTVFSHSYKFSYHLFLTFFCALSKEPVLEIFFSCSKWTWTTFLWYWCNALQSMKQRVFLTCFNEHGFVLKRKKKYRQTFLQEV